MEPQDIIQFGKDELEHQIASKFPDQINQLVDEFFDNEINPELLGYLKKNKGRILDMLKEDIVGRAVENAVGRLI